ncbi:MAG: hypothetical protein AAF705_11405 [Bacteroidota bacterium]
MSGVVDTFMMYDNTFIVDSKSNVAQISKFFTDQYFGDRNLILVESGLPIWLIDGINGNQSIGSIQARGQELNSLVIDLSAENLTLDDIFISYQTGDYRFNPVGPLYDQISSFTNRKFDLRQKASIKDVAAAVTARELYSFPLKTAESDIYFKPKGKFIEAVNQFNTSLSAFRMNKEVLDSTGRYTSNSEPDPTIRPFFFTNASTSQGKTFSGSEVQFLRFRYRITSNSSSLSLNRFDFRPRFNGTNLGGNNIRKYYNPPADTLWHTALLDMYLLDVSTGGTWEDQTEINSLEIIFDDAPTGFQVEFDFIEALTAQDVIGLSSEVGVLSLDRDIEIKASCIIDTTIWLNTERTVGIFRGTGSPESSISAGIGSTFHRTDGAAGTSFYFKESGTGNTGWIAKGITNQLTGLGTPAGSITPQFIGQIYIDTTTSGSEVGYLAIGIANTDWKQITN